MGRARPMQRPVPSVVTSGQDGRLRVSRQLVSRSRATQAQAQTPAPNRLITQSRPVPTAEIFECPAPHQPHGLRTTRPDPEARRIQPDVSGLRFQIRPARVWLLESGRTPFRSEGPADQRRPARRGLSAGDLKLRSSSVESNYRLRSKAVHADPVRPLVFRSRPSRTRGDTWTHSPGTRLWWRRCSSGCGLRRPIRRRRHKRFTGA